MITSIVGKCCFDYGNSETNDRDDGAGAMEAIYFGNAHWRGNTGAGPEGPWAGADLESGMYVTKPIHLRVPFFGSVRSTALFPFIHSFIRSFVRLVG